jgi:hypothetical protein
LAVAFFVDRFAVVRLAVVRRRVARAPLTRFLPDVAVARVDSFPAFLAAEVFLGAASSAAVVALGTVCLPCAGAPVMPDLLPRGQDTYSCHLSGSCALTASVNP